MDERNDINLKELTDKQKMLLTQLSYLNITDEGFEKIQQEGVTVRELEQYLDPNNADEPYTGNWGNNKELEELLNIEYKVAETMMDIGAGKGTISTERELLQELIDEGLGDLKITDIISNDKGLDSITNGLQAMAFEDESGNKGISYAGSDFDIDAIGDWVISDAGEYLTNDSQQARDAHEFFERNKDENGNNYIYGHSLGGNLTAHTYVKNYDEIQEAVTINGTPINTDELSKEQIEALNDPKYNCCVVGLDPVSQLKDYGDYADNVKYIRNNGEQGDNPLYAHSIQSATYDENGNLILEDSKEKAYDKENILSKTFTDTAEFVHNGIKDIRNVQEYRRKCRKECS